MVVQRLLTNLVLESARANRDGILLAYGMVSQFVVRLADLVGLLDFRYWLHEQIALTA